MPDIFFTIAIMALTLGVLVTFHEFGHFWVARRCGVRVLRFSIGFGPALVTWRDRSGTEFALAAIPLGGYVKMLDERETQVAEQDLAMAFNRKPVGQRIAIVSAGPLANFLLAIVAFWVVHVSGVSGVAPIIDSVVPVSLAERAGLESGQEIVAVDGTETPTWRSLHMQLLGRIGESGTITFATRYPDSDLVYESRAQLDEWMAGQADADLVKGLGIELYRPTVKPVVDRVMPDSPAARAGIREGDRIVAVDGETVTEWRALVDYISQHPGETITIALRRDGERTTVTATPEAATNEQGERQGRLGVGVKPPEWPERFLREQQYGLLGAWVPALEQTWAMTRFTLVSIKKMLTGLISTKNLSGPITIAKVASDSAQTGLEAYLGFLALLSISLGVLNLLPIPVLDGGHIFFYLIELVKGTPVSERVQMVSFQIGLSLVVGLMLLAIYNDLARL